MAYWAGSNILCIPMSIVTVLITENPFPISLVFFIYFKRFAALLAYFFDLFRWLLQIPAKVYTLFRFNVNSFSGVK